MEKQLIAVAPIQADAATFKHLVQQLTGAPRGGSARKLRPRAAVSRRSPFKLQDRRKHYSVGDIETIKLVGDESAGNSPENVPTATAPPEEEERAIAEKGFYLHASPEKAAPPVLLTLFPLTSPKHDV